MPLHLFGESLELVPKAGVNLPLSGDEVGNPPVRSEIADNDDGVVGQDELFQTLVVTAVDDIGEDGLAVAAEEVLDDIGADFAVGGVVEGVAHMLHCLGFIYIYRKTYAVFHFFGKIFQLFLGGGAGLTQGLGGGLIYPPPGAIRLYAISFCTFLLALQEQVP